MITHNIGFYEKKVKIIFQLSSNTHFICSSVAHILLCTGELKRGYDIQNFYLMY